MRNQKVRTTLLVRLPTRTECKNEKRIDCKEGIKGRILPKLSTAKIRNRSMLKQAQNLYFHSMYLLQDLMRPEMGTTLSKNDIEGIQKIYDAITQRVSDLSRELDEDEKT